MVSEAFFMSKKNRNGDTPRLDAPPNPLLPLLIEMANVGELPDPFEAIYPPPSDASDDDLRKLWIKSCADLAATLPPPARAYLGSPEEDVRKFSANYEFLVSGQQIVRALAQRYSDGTESKLPLTAFDSKFSADFPISRESDLILDEKGSLAHTDDPVLSAFKGVADRIRCCKICGRFFWAPRGTSECCPTKCRKTYNQRIRRKRDREKQNALMAIESRKIYDRRKLPPEGASRSSE
jgi:hypothetical protein